jgi:hypothetical protein
LFGCLKGALDRSFGKQLRVGTLAGGESEKHKRMKHALILALDLATIKG